MVTEGDNSVDQEVTPPWLDNKYFKYTTPSSKDKVDWYPDRVIHGFAATDSTEYDSESVKSTEENNYGDIFAHELDLLAKDYGWDSIKPVLGNTGANSIMWKNRAGVNGGVVSYALTNEPYNHQLEIGVPRKGDKLYKSLFPHEIPHIMSVTFRNINSEGGVRLHSREQKITSITGFKNSTDFLPLMEKFKTKQGVLKSKEFKTHLYDRFMQDTQNNQRPELKNQLAITVSSILSDPKLQGHFKNLVGKGFDKEYVYTPEEMWSMAWEQYSILKRNPKDKHAKKLISKEVLDNIKTLLDTVKIVHGNTMSNKENANTSEAIA